MKKERAQAEVGWGGLSRPNTYPPAAVAEGLTTAPVRSVSPLC